LVTLLQENAVQEKRKNPRVKDKLVVVCQLPNGGEMETIEHSEDISDSGIRITIPKSVSKGDVITFKINLFEDAIPISAKGKIVWKKQIMPSDALKDVSGENDVAGLEFSGMDAVEAARIQSYFKRKVRKANDL
jgi:hypothetical protein